MMLLRLVEVPPNSLDIPRVIDLESTSVAQQSRLRIGRLKRECDVVLQSAYVSKRHCDLIAGEDGWVITDMQSRAGTKLNGIRLKPKVPYQVHHGDTIRFCGYQFVVECDDSNSNTGSSSDIPIVDDDSGFESVITNPGLSWSNLTAASAQNKLQLLLEMIRDLRHSEKIEQQLRRLIDRLFKLIPAGRRAMVLVSGNPSGESGYHITVTKPADASSPPIALRQAVAEAYKQKKAVLTEDRQVICVPLLDRDEVLLGCLQMESLGDAQLFTPRELDLLAGAGLLVAFAIENSLYQSAIDRDRLQQQELRMARDIQRSLLPPAEDCVGDYEFFACYDAALQVGGDYYDFVELPHGLLAVALGDVSGKGIPASLLMAKVSSEIRVLLDMGCDPAQVLQRVNQRFAERNTVGRFITLALLTIELHDHRLVLANAGHPRPLLRYGDGSIEELGDDTAGFALGIEATEQYGEYSRDFPEDGTLVLFSDGVTDARSMEGELFGLERLMKALATAGPTASEAGQAILEAIQSHLGDQPNQDDLCLVCVRRTPHSSSGVS